MTETLALRLPDATLVYDVDGSLPPSEGQRPLLMIGQPMDASGFADLAAQFPDRTVVRYDPRGLGRSTRTDGLTSNDPATQAGDVHALIAALGAGPVDLFASSGGAVTALALVERHPRDVAILVAHEPPINDVLPDADLARRMFERVNERYADAGFGAGMAAFIAFTSVEGEFTDDHLGQLAPDPAAFGLPSDDDGTRGDPLLSGSSSDVVAFVPDVEALRAAPTHVVLAFGVESGDTYTARTTKHLAALLGQEPTVFPSHHGGFVGGGGWPGEPEAFGATLREVLDAAPVSTTDLVG